jgi:hypothetical protein
MSIRVADVARWTIRAGILWRAPTTGENGLWEMNGFLIAGAQAIPGVSAAWEIH